MWMINLLQGCNVEQQSKITDLSRENEQHEENFSKMRQTVKTLEERCLTLEERLMNEVTMVRSLEGRLEKETEEHKTKHDDHEAGNKALTMTVQYLKEKLANAEEEVAFLSGAGAVAGEAKYTPSSEYMAKIKDLQTEKQKLHTQITQQADSIEDMRQTQRETTTELSRAQQTIQILKSKERYLESRVESLANQISKTVQEYESRLSTSGSDECGASIGSRSSRSTRK